MAALSGFTTGRDKLKKPAQGLIEAESPSTSTSRTRTVQNRDLRPKSAARIQSAMNNDERRLMDEHGHYCQGHFQAGTLLLYGTSHGTEPGFRACRTRSR
jgi:hypothetical protein